MTGGFGEKKGPWEPRDTDDRVEVQDSVEGQGEGGAAEAGLSDLLRSGLSAPESVLERLLPVAAGVGELGR